MLNKICNSETEQELHDSINYTLYHSALRRYYKKRTEYNPLLENVKTASEEEKNVFDCNIFRGIKVTEDFDIEQAFDKLGVFNAKMFDFCHGKDSYIEKINYDSRKIDNCNSRGNTTSFSISSGESFSYTKSNGILFVIKPNKEKYEEIFGMVDLIDNHYFEVNTPDIETTDVAFALKYKNGLIEDVVFNKNFDGEFYKDGKLISQEELKQYILSIISNISNHNEYVLAKRALTNFLEKKLKIERVLKVETKTKEEDIPSDIQNLICSNVSDLLKLKQVNDIIKLYYECKNINKKLSEYNNQNKNAEIESIIENINVIIKSIGQIENLDNFDLKSKKLEFEKQIIEFLSINEDVRNTVAAQNPVAAVLVSTYIDRILNEYNSFEKNVRDNINKVIINFGTMQHLGKLYSMRHSINLSRETIDNILRKVLNDEDSKNLTTFINCIKKENFLKSTNTIIETRDILTIINHKKCNDTVLSAIIDKISAEELLKTRKIIINRQEYDNLLEVILSNKECNYFVLQTIIDKISAEELLKTRKIIINRQEYNNILEATLSNKECNYFVLKTIIGKISVRELLKTKKITINGNKYTNLLKAILNHEKCNEYVLESIIDKISVEELFNKKITINRQKYNNLLGAILNHDKCNKYVLSAIIGKISVQELLETRTIRINGQKYNNLLGAILNHEKCDGYILESIIDKISTEELFNKEVIINRNKYTNLLEVILSNKECYCFVLQTIIGKISVQELLETRTIRIDGQKYNNLLRAILNHEKCNGYVLESIIGKTSTEELLKTRKIRINGQKYNNLLEVFLSNKECNDSVLWIIIDKISAEELFNKEVTINKQKYNILEAILNNKHYNDTVLQTIINKIINNTTELFNKEIINKQKYTNLLKAILSNKECDGYVLSAIIDNTSAQELLETKITINGNEYTNLLGAILNQKKCNEFILQAIVEKIDIKKFLEKKEIVTINKEGETIICDNVLGAVVNHEKCNHFVLQAIIDKIERIECIKNDSIQILYEANCKYLKEVKQEIQDKIEQLKKDSIHGLVHKLNFSLSRSLVELDRRTNNNQKVGL